MSEVFEEGAAGQIIKIDEPPNFWGVNTGKDYENRLSKNKTKRFKKPQTEPTSEQLVFDFESALLRGSLSGAIFGSLDYREAVRGAGANGNTSEGAVLGSVRQVEQSNAERIFGEIQSVKASGTDRQRNSFSTSYPLSAVNYRLTEENFTNRGGAKTRFKNNIAAIKLLYELEENQTQVTKEQQDILVKYAGWGGLAEAFDQLNEKWQKEYIELKELLKPEDYRRAKESVLSSFYTSKTVIDGIYDGLRRIGFNAGTVLEPALGTGNFLGLMPDDFNTMVYGVELDNITGRIAKHLYPKANIKVIGFEQTDFPDGFFDSVITNVPFGSFKVFDEKYQKHDLFIHDYFILKSLDKLRAGGVAAIVTSKGTMDKLSGYARRIFSERAELVGAIRLPNNAFKETANTEVTSDILYFKKRSEYNFNYDEDWLETGENSDGITVNKYFITHPEMILGKMTKGKSMYGGDDETYCAGDGRNLIDDLREAVARLPLNVYTAEEVKFKDGFKLLAQDVDIKNHCYGMINDKIYLRADSELIPQSIPYVNLARLRSMIELRQAVRDLLQAQIDDCPDNILEDKQERLNRNYDNFVRRFGYLNTKANKVLFRDDADFTLLLSLENYDESSGKATKTDIFTKRTIRKYVRPEKAETALEALHICKNETANVDIKIIEELTGKSFVEVVEELRGQIYRNPDKCDLEDKYSGYETAAEYLSGNVREKLASAKIALHYSPDFQENIAALEKAQPILLTASEINAKLGVSWIDKDIYKQFILKKLQPGNFERNRINVEFNTYSAEWKVEASGIKTFESANVYGTKRVNGFKLFEYALNLQNPSVYDTTQDENGKEKRVLNKSETIAAREKLRKIQEEFKAWVFDDPDRRNHLVEVYNHKFNNLVLKKHDGSYLTFPQMNPFIELKDYQRDAVERIITSGNTLLHHVMGAGKTFEIAAAAMKLRQMKLAQKPMIVVPNHLVLQWAHEFRTLYPNAKLLVATKKDFEKENRLRFVSRIATGDWDAVVMAMSSFEKIPISSERQQKKIQEEIDNVEKALEEMRHDREKRITVKILQRILKNKTAQFNNLASSKKDNLIKFEDLGVDYLFIDEAHKFKNKFIFTKMNNVAGISKAMSKRATDLDMKIDYIQELHKGQKGVVFATGTPISNSMVEMYTLQSYLAKYDLEKAGLKYFDDWAANFGEIQSALELAPSGQGYRSRTRFSKFVNLPELLKMYRNFADVKTADMLNLPVPKANKKVITIKPTDDVLRLNEDITERAERINGGGVDPQVDNMLKITGDGKKLALDPRCFDRSARDDIANKVNIAIENIYKIWNDTQDSRSAQLVFCDLSTPKKDYKDYNSETDFDVYNDVKVKLAQMGVPSYEIAFIHQAESDASKQALFDNVRSGNVRILLGSTEKCGAGTNIQNKLIAIHHLDTPYRPSDMQQREGRGIRQGNENLEIDIFTYVTERTFDAYSYQILENKQRFISQINNGELTVREAADIDEATLTYSEIKAITSANPLIKRKFEVENELNNLRILQGQYRSNRYNLQDSAANYLPEAIEGLKVKIANYELDISLKNDNLTEEFFMTVNNKPYSERKDAAEALHKYTYNGNAGKKIAALNGFDISPEWTGALADTYVCVKGNGSYKVQTSESALGTLTRLENFFKNMEESLNSLRANLLTKETELAAAKEELKKPFEHEQKLLDLSGELAEIDAQLNLDKTEIAPIVDDEEFQNEKAEVEAETDEPDEEETESIFESYNAEKVSVQKIDCCM